MVKTLFTQKSADEYYIKVLAPALKHRGYASMLWRSNWIVVVSKPEIVSQLFRNTDRFPKSMSNFPGILGKYIGPSNILISNGDEWKRHRKPANPIFHQKFQPELFSPCIEEVLNSIMDKVSRNPEESIQVCDLMSLLTLDVLGKGIFSIDFEAIKSEGSSKYHQLYYSIMKQVGSPLYSLIPFLNHYPVGDMAKAYRSLDEFKEVIQALISQRRKDLKDKKFEDSKDLLSTLLRETEKNHEDPLTDEELVYNMNVFFAAGHDTTSSALACGMYYLAKNPIFQEKLRNEVLQALGTSSASDKITVPEESQIKEMNYLGLFIKEVMRLNPPISQVFRGLTEDYSIPDDDVILPKGTIINLPIYAIHHDPKIYPNPEEFNPERFLNGKYDTDVYMPFGGGSRMCVGFNFSLMEQKVFFIMLLQKFIIEIMPDNPDFEKLRIMELGQIRPLELKLNFKPVL
ncbi:cytochrome P450 [Conidiobolus coronatus NRRL 28638]|uniref:Cytochrome P450 n=1 Tax=Conidiobolus coronatus (strain ATCC 28846 / CBS 209.66 / NRRL 28638) TaxID=796925 RepID=A0A137PIU7_CONC2|nr:cytochrome P450 [Conidiobolus coronatus NRRL 28638]|eukprot:KXN74926.1 cytochrome P450 [Conidiobolus coronatus NRRL 28638]